jgi:hypothetical protein
VTADHQGSTGLCVTVHLHPALPSLAATATEVRWQMQH